MAVAVVDGDKGVWKAVHAILSGSAEFHCCGCFRTGAEALEGIPELGARIVLVGAVLPDGCGMQCVRRLLARRPGLGVILASSHALDEEMVRRALAAGVNVCCRKPLRAEWLLPLVRSMAARSFPEHRVAGPMELRVHAAPSLAEGSACKETGERLAAQLTGAEDQVMACLAQSMLHKETAACLGFSVAKVKALQHKAYEKLGKHKAVEAVAAWRETESP